MSLEWFRERELPLYDPWSWLESEDAEPLRAQFRRETAAPNPMAVKDFLPFARRHDQDDVAGFVVTDGVVGAQVISVHLTWRQGPESPGWPSHSRHAGLWEWLAEVMLPDARYLADLDGQ